MKVLFAVNNDDISEAIVKKYQKNYREILSYKNVYYFNAILKELQRDKTYDRVVISEDLEPFANNNYDAIDKFLFEKLDKISDEATNAEGDDTDIIFICGDRRNKGDEMLSKLFGIGVYSAIIGQDRSTDEVCRLINLPRTKKEAKQYYKIEGNTAGYQVESENSVSETEVQNILAHYKKLGKNEDKYVDSFDNIVSQYNDEQLKIIIRYLPIGVKAVLEERSPKYQQLVSFADGSMNNSASKSVNAKKEGAIQVEMLKNESGMSKISRPIIIPSNVNKNEVKRLIKQQPREEKIEEPNIAEIEEPNIVENEITSFELDDELNELMDNSNSGSNDSNNNSSSTNTNDQPKRGRGRPRKNPLPTEEELNKPKRGRGRPRKNPLPETQNNDNDDLLDLFSMDSEDTSNTVKNDEEDIDLFDLGNGFEDNKNDDDIDLFDLGNDSQEESKEEDIDLFDLGSEATRDDFSSKQDNTSNVQKSQEVGMEQSEYKAVNTSNFATTLSKDKKVVCFVGTTKNGTSFIVNNAAHMLASMGISTAILDLTKTKNAYYIYTNSEQQLMDIAKNSINNLRSGVAEGIKVNKNLTVYTALPDDYNDYNDVDGILGTLTKNHSVVLIDCDFDTPMEYFGAAQEMYLVQSMDVLTIQPLTAFLRNLQSKGILKQEKIKIVINKGVNIKSVPIKTLIGGISKYNDPSMSYMKDLFNKDTVPYCVIPFEVQNYTKYLDAVITCTISLNGYTKPLMSALRQLCDMIYPLISRQTYSPRGDKYKNEFSSEMNDTLSKMKKKYN